MENAERLVKTLIQKNMRICCAESCTGGMLTSSLVDVPDASNVIDMGFVTYSNTAKRELLGVSAESIKRFGVVSEQVAGEMASGAARVSGAQIGVGISGIAGPGGGSVEKPVGMVCFGFCVNGHTVTNTVLFGNAGRQTVRENACKHAINMILEII